MFTMCRDRLAMVQLAFGDAGSRKHKMHLEWIDFFFMADFQFSNASTDDKTYTRSARQVLISVAGDL